MSVKPHQSLPEGEKRWLHHLPRPRVVSDRIAWTASTVTGLDVVHLGFADVGCETTRERDGNWLHGVLADRTARLVGLDVTTSGVRNAQQRGFEVYPVDCTDPDAVAALNLGQFEVVLAGELIEHVDNPGGLLRSAGELVSPGGTLLLSTPNARRLGDVAHAASGREIVHPDHVAIYSARTLTALLERHGWAVDELLVYTNPRPSRAINGWKDAAARGVNALQRALVRTTSPYLADGLIVRAVR